MEIEDKPVSPKHGRSRGDFEEFVRTLGRLQAGQSFLYPKELSNQQRIAMSCCYYLTGKRIISRKEGSGCRIGAV